MFLCLVIETTPRDLASNLSLTIKRQILSRKERVDSKVIAGEPAMYVLCREV